MGLTCDQLHQISHRLPLHAFPFDAETIPLNGIYILFEKGKTGHGTERIVRIGAHTGVDQLGSRLMQHFMLENKDRSIFRKNIGRAILNRDHDPFLKQWELDLTSHEAKEKYQNKIDLKKQASVEQLVSQTIQENFRFVVFRVDKKDERLRWEERVIATVSLCSECRPSKEWLGNYSPVEKIRESGLWNVQGLYKDGISEWELEKLEKMIGGE